MSAMARFISALFRVFLSSSPPLQLAFTNGCVRRRNQRQVYVSAVEGRRLRLSKHILNMVVWWWLSHYKSHKRGRIYTCH